MPKRKKRSKKSPSKSRSSKTNKKARLNSDSKLFAFLAVLLSLLGFVIAILVKSKDKYVMFYAKQSLIIFIASAIAGIISLVPIFGWFVGPILQLVILVLWILGMVYAFSGEMKEIPLIGHYAKQLNL